MFVGGFLKTVNSGISFTNFLISTKVECAEGPCEREEVPISAVNTFGLP